MIRPEDVYQIGRMGKAHGLKGEINFQFTDDVWDRADSDYIIDVAPVETNRKSMTF